MTGSADSTLRDPAGDAAQYAAEIDKLREHEASCALDDSGAIADQVWVAHSRGDGKAKLLMHLHAAGLPLERLREETAAVLPELTKAEEVVNTHGPVVGAQWAGFQQVRADRLSSYAFAAFVLLLLEREEQLQQWEKLVSVLPKNRSFLFDLLVKAFVPAHAMAKKYPVDKETGAFTGPLLRALAQPEAQRSAALAKCIKGWGNSMRSWGWKPSRDTQSGRDKPWPVFAFDIALAVCAYDIDDSGFRDHPYYPRELVEHYRAHLRSTRDAWRADKVGAGVEVVAPPAPPKADLAKSKRKGAARWVELVCDGDDGAVESVLDVIGKPKKIGDLGELLDALAGDGHALHADIKDDASVASSAAQLAAVRALGEFDAPPRPPAGPARCSALLMAFSAWVQERGYTLLDLDNKDDAWHAVLVKSAYADELAQLSGQLGILTRPPQQAYA